MRRNKNTKLWLAILVFLVSTTLAMTFFYNLNKNRALELERTLETSIQAFIDSGAAGISSGYFQWSELYDAINGSDLVFVEDQLDELVESTLIAKSISIIDEPYLYSGDYHVYSDGNRILIAFRIYDDLMDYALTDKVAVMEVDIDKLLDVTLLSQKLDYSHKVFDGLRELSLKSKVPYLRVWHYISALSIGCLTIMLIQYFYSFSVKSHFEIEGLEAVVQILSHKDEYTAEHSKSVANLSVQIAKKMGLPRKEVRDLFKAGHLHDIGKIGVPERIINKKGKLTAEEYVVIQKHPEIGYEIVSQFPNLKEIALIVRSHHEMLDGSGYPQGLKENEIPLTTQILSVADVYDALTSDRPYRKGNTMERAFEILESMPLNQDIVRTLKEEVI